MKNPHKAWYTHLDKAGEKKFSKPEMDALMFDPRKNTVSLIKTNLPAIVEKHDVIVKVVYTGVCATDLHIIDGSIPCRERPFIPGHEFCGVASSIGSEVKHIKRGDRVVVDPYSGCGVCTYCVSGRYHQCPAYKAIGIHSDGGWAQYCKVPAQQVHLVPECMTLQEAVLCESLSCVCHGWDRVAPLPIGSTVLVLGAGIVGNLWMSLLHFSGHRNVVIAEPLSTRRTLNQKLNTGFKCLSHEEVLALKVAHPNWGVDLCVDCNGNEQALEQGLSLLLPGGKLCIFGVSALNTTVSVLPSDIFKKELTIVGVLLNHFCFQKALSLIEAMGSRYLDYEKLGIKVYSLDQYKEAFVCLKKGTISKAVFKLSSGPD